MGPMEAFFQLLSKQLKLRHEAVDIFDGLSRYSRPFQSPEPGESRPIHPGAGLWGHELALSPPGVARRRPCDPPDHSAPEELPLEASLWPGLQAFLQCPRGQKMTHLALFATLNAHL